MLESATIIDDLEFAKWWVDNRMRNSSRSKLALKSELFAKGIDRDIIEQVLKDVSDEEYIEAGLRLALKKIKLKKFQTPKERKSYILRYLSQKGYFSEMIFKIIDIIENK